MGICITQIKGAPAPERHGAAILPHPSPAIRDSFTEPRMNAPVFRSSLVMTLILCSALSGCGGLQGLRSASAPANKLEVPANADPASLLASADAAYIAQDWGRAEQDFLALSRLQPANSQPPYKLGNLYTRTGKLEQASAAYAEAVRRDPGFDRAWHNLGIAQLRQARASLAKAAESPAPDEPEVRQRAARLTTAIDALLAAKPPAK